MREETAAMIQALHNMKSKMTNIVATPNRQQCPIWRKNSYFLDVNQTEFHAEILVVTT
jgi:hypothetical protein